jgi:hypothetical protein
MTVNDHALRPRRQQGTFNKLEDGLAAALASPLDGAEWGPAMKALPSDRHRAFVISLYQIKPGYGSQVKAAKMAGFGTSTSTAKSWSVIASRLAHDDKIQEAIHEEDQKRIRASAPRAIRALENLLEKPDHRDHARAIALSLDRAHPVETTHNVKVDHRHQVVVPIAEVMQRIRNLALTAGLDHRLMPPMIDGTCHEVPADAEQEKTP